MCLKLTPWVAIGSVPVWLAVVLVLVVVEAVAADVQPQIAGESRAGAAWSGGRVRRHARSRATR